MVKILDEESSLLRDYYGDYYGDYYVSEMIRHPFETRRLFVAVNNNILDEEEEEIVGVMCLNNCLDLLTLNENFELDALAGLRKKKIINDTRTAIEDG